MVCLVAIIENGLLPTHPRTWSHPRAFWRCGVSEELGRSPLTDNPITGDDPSWARVRAGSAQLGRFSCLISRASFAHSCTFAQRCGPFALQRCCADGGLGELTQCHQQVKRLFLMRSVRGLFNVGATAMVYRHFVDSTRGSIGGIQCGVTV